MRLLNVHTLQFGEFYSSPPAYVVTSHRWSAGNELMYEDIRTGKMTDTSGGRKVQGFADFIRSNMPQITWMWIDTCCVNQDSDKEVSEAVNSMFNWYSRAEMCLAYMLDVRNAKEMDEFAHSEWFRRGWTLQELLAPCLVVFLSRDWTIIGSKGGLRAGSNYRFDIPPSLEHGISNRTGIPLAVLGDFTCSRKYSVDVRLKWMDGRETTREEDIIYSLLGIFGVTLPIIYGERISSARRRLMKEISETAHYERRYVKSGSRPKEVDSNLFQADLRVSAVDGSQDHESIWYNEEIRMNCDFFLSAVKTALDAMHRGDYFAADSHFSEAGDYAAKIPGEHYEELLPSIALGMAICAFHIHDAAKAEELLTGVLNSPVAAKYKSLEICEVRHLLAQVYIKRGRLEQALGLCQQVYAERIRLLGENDLLSTESLALLSRIHGLNGDMKLATRIIGRIQSSERDKVQQKLSSLWPPVQIKWSNSIELQGPESGVLYNRPIAFSADGKTFVSITDSDFIKVWDVASGREKLRLSREGVSAYRPVLSQTGEQIAAIMSRVYETYSVKVWMPKVHKPPSVHNLSSRSFPKCLTFLPDDSLLVGQWHNEHSGFTLMNLASGETILKLPELEDTTVEISADGRIISNFNANGRVRAWIVSSGQKVLDLHIQGCEIRHLQLSPEGTRIAVRTTQSISVFDIKTGKEIRRHEFPNPDLMILPFLDPTVSANCDWVLHQPKETEDRFALHELAPKSTERILECHGFATAAVSNRCQATFSPNDQILAAVNIPGTIRFWDVASLRSNSDNLLRMS